MYNYEKQTWVDEVRNPDNTFNMSENQDGTVALTKAGTLQQVGSNMSAARWNHMEDGIAKANNAVKEVSGTPAAVTDSVLAGIMVELNGVGINGIPANIQIEEGVHIPYTSHEFRIRAEQYVDNGGFGLNYYNASGAVLLQRGFARASMGEFFINVDLFALNNNVALGDISYITITSISYGVDVYMEYCPKPSSHIEYSGIKKVAAKKDSSEVIASLVTQFRSLSSYTDVLCYAREQFTDSDGNVVRRGEYYKKEYVKERIFKGSENWEAYATYTNNGAYCYKCTDLKNSQAMAKSNAFIQDYSISNNKELYTFLLNPSGLFVMTPYSTLDKFKAQIASNNFAVYYTNGAYTTHRLPASDQAALTSLKSYAGNTTVYTPEVSAKCTMMYATTDLGALLLNAFIDNAASLHDSDIVDHLMSTAANLPLSANMGRALNTDLTNVKNSDLYNGKHYVSYAEKKYIKLYEISPIAGNVSSDMRFILSYRGYGMVTVDAHFNTNGSNQISPSVSIDKSNFKDFIKVFNDLTNNKVEIWAYVPTWNNISEKLLTIPSTVYYFFNKTFTVSNTAPTVSDNYVLANNGYALNSENVAYGTASTVANEISSLNENFITKRQSVNANTNYVFTLPSEVGAYRVVFIQSNSGLAETKTLYISPMLSEGSVSGAKFATDDTTISNLSLVSLIAFSNYNVTLQFAEPGIVSITKVL